MKTIEEVKKFIAESPDYDFLRTNTTVKENLLFLTMGGSIAYGTERHDENGDIISDIDVRGVMMPPKDSIYGLKQFEQFIDNQSDTVIYEFRKFISLISNCNPNTIELLGSVQRNSIYSYGDLFSDYINNIDAFISKKAIYSFGGYANAQLLRLKNALARETPDEKEALLNIKNSLDRQIAGFNETHTDFKDGNIKINVDTINGDLNLYIDINLENYPMIELMDILNDLNICRKTCTQLNKRNHKKDLQHLNKHAMHLVRLYHMGIELLDSGVINTYREKDLDLLNSIRNGAFSIESEQGTSFKPEFFDMVSELNEKLNAVSITSNVPKNPNYELINKLMINTFNNFYNLK